MIVINNEELKLWVTLTIGATSGTKLKSKQFPKTFPLYYRKDLENKIKRRQKETRPGTKKIN